MSTPVAAHDAPPATIHREPPFRADHVGSFLRPKLLLDARQQFQSGAIDAAALREVEDEAIRGIVKFQETSGVRGITDGEFRAPISTSIPDPLEGVQTKGGIAELSQQLRATSIFPAGMQVTTRCVM